MQGRGRHRSTGPFLAVCAGCLGLSLLTALPVMSGPRALATGVIAPAEAGLTAVWDAGGRAASVFGDISSLNARNRAMAADNARLRARLAQLQAAGAENDSLRRALDFERRYGHAMVPAQVIGRSPDGLSRVLIIDRGRDAGIRGGMVVVTGSGLVGRVIDAGPSSARVQTLADPGSRVNVYTVTAGLDGTISGGPGRMRMEVHPQPGRVAAGGEAVLTSGVGGTYPRGIPVGVVVRFQRQDSAMVELAEVAWAEDYTTVSTVLVITDYHDPLTGPPA